MTLNRFLTCAALLSISLTASAAEPAELYHTIPYASPDVGTQDVRDECRWNTALAGYASTYAKGAIHVTDKDLSHSTGRMLTLRVTAVHAIGGGGFSGPKWARIRGELHDHGRQLGSFEALRYTRRGFTGCAALDHIAKALGKDVAVWLRNPVPNARLGDLD